MNEPNIFFLQPIDMNREML